MCFDYAVAGRVARFVLVMNDGELMLQAPGELRRAPTLAEGTELNTNALEALPDLCIIMMAPHYVFCIMCA